jgi:ribosomal protein S18 acetylase RimI-like enzyme
MVDNQAVHLRIAGVQDAELLASLGAKTFSDSFAVDNTAEDMVDYLQESFSKQKQAEELEMADSVFIIAESEGEAIGYARLLGRSTETCITGPKPVELVRIYVLQAWKGKRVGSLLMQKCLEEARGRGYATIWLGVWENNPNAIAFYQKWGFEKVGTHTFKLGSDLQQDWIMQRSLE